MKNQESGVKTPLSGVCTSKVSNYHLLFALSLANERCCNVDQFKINTRDKQHGDDKASTQEQSLTARAGSHH
jgi:hypothetical protein